MKPRGFTLIELLVVIAVIAVLAAILFPVFAKAREKARQTTCINNQRQMTLAMTMYTQDNMGYFPSSDSVWTDLQIGTKSLLCPSISAKVGNRNHYGYNASLSGASIGDLANPTATVAFADAVVGEDNRLKSGADVDLRHGKKAIYAFADGHVDVRDARLAVLIATRDLFIGQDTDQLVNNQYGWTRSPAADDSTYPGYYANFTSSDGSPAPSLYMKNTTATRTLAKLTSVASLQAWAVSATVKLKHFNQNSDSVPDHSIIIKDSVGAGREIANVGFFRKCPDSNSGVYSCRLNGKFVDSVTISGIGYGGNVWPQLKNSWNDLTIVCAKGMVTCTLGEKSLTVAAKSPSTWQDPSSLSISFGNGDALIDNVKFVDL
jgi:prepilin-type N-terminal cleavage/methylation domain-containing protein/prepilin-type processing-associated H-X9-DG protein